MEKCLLGCTLVEWSEATRISLRLKFSSEANLERDFSIQFVELRQCLDLESELLAFYKYWKQIELIYASIIRLNHWIRLSDVKSLHVSSQGTAIPIDDDYQVHL